MTERSLRRERAGQAAPKPSPVALRLAHCFGWGLLGLSLVLGAWTMPVRAAVVTSDATRFTVGHQSVGPIALAAPVDAALANPTARLFRFAATGNPE